ncbi:HAD-IIIC family phosphatase [Paenibacillus filicis]|uniref:HAD-IIIC family phosphatase n=1 Tax=Paenibacillus gyeongsangnamensis TaxID=3388067 RepID=A0ABT4Q8P2_9BACL|nr:HAD-IIIC family phosphatase [Paenibacillus filicis]MCZ8513156.1 HAD-IIIC family phosphatase [Paenibacillus filicis]
MDTKEQIHYIRQLKSQNLLGENRTNVVHIIKENRNALFCEKIGYTFKNVTLEDWNASGEKPLKPLKVAVISNFTSDAFALMLRPLLLSEGIWPELYTAGFNQYYYELMNEHSGLYEFSPQVTVCLFDERLMLDELPREWGTADLEEACERKIEQFNQLLNIYHQQSQGLLVLHTVPLSSDTYNIKIDYKTKAQLSRIWRSFNIKLLELAEEWSQVITLDTEVLLQEHQVSRLRDPRLMQYGSFNLSEEVLFAFAAESVKVARSIVGLTKKGLVLDLDNTLWGGIVGDDGLNGVQLGDSAPGKIFVEFQKAIRHLKNQGVLLTVSSKNEESLVREMLDQHPHMQLGMEDIVMLRANWNPKHENIEAIAEGLNIGLDSLVFIDDNPFERNLVREALPAVIVPEMPQDPSYYPETLLSSGWFNTIKLTSTDLNRTNQYKKEVERDQLMKSSASVEDYLQSLDMHLHILPVNEFYLPRLAQLNVRTNQFNMTTRRYQESEIEHMEGSGSYWVFGFQTTDRFGDYGIIGSVIVEKQVTAWRIRNFLMSCRVFSRKIETAILRHVLLKAQEEGAREIIGEYIPTAKNVIVKDFYVQHGFERVQGDRLSSDDKANPELEVFVHTLEHIPDEVTWIKMHTGEEVTAL